MNTEKLCVICNKEEFYESTAETRGDSFIKICLPNFFILNYVLKSAYMGQAFWVRIYPNENAACNMHVRCFVNTIPDHYKKKNYKFKHKNIQNVPRIIHDHIYSLNKNNNAFSTEELLSQYNFTTTCGCCEKRLLYYDTVYEPDVFHFDEKENGKLVLISKEHNWKLLKHYHLLFHLECFTRMSTYFSSTSLLSKLLNN